MDTFSFRCFLWPQKKRSSRKAKIVTSLRTRTEKHSSWMTQRQDGLFLINMMVYKPRVGKGEEKHIWVCLRIECQNQTLLYSIRKPWFTAIFQKVINSSFGWSWILNSLVYALFCFQTKTQIWSFCRNYYSSSKRITKTKIEMRDFQAQRPKNKWKLPNFQLQDWRMTIM